MDNSWGNGGESENDLLSRRKLRCSSFLGRICLIPIAFLIGVLGSALTKDVTALVRHHRDGPPMWLTRAEGMGFDAKCYVRRRKDGKRESARAFFGCSHVNEKVLVMSQHLEPYGGRTSTLNRNDLT